MHGTGNLSVYHTSDLTLCCALRASLDFEAFTWHADTGICDLIQAPLNYHVSAGTQHATSGCRSACPRAPAPFPGAGPFAPARYPPALTAMPSMPTFQHPPRPNIVFFYGDDIGYGDLGAFGNPTAATPALDRMAANGAKLVQYYSAASICSPSRASLMTGRTFGRIGIYPGVLSPLSRGGLPLNETTVATKLKTVGYKTGMCGKWHLGTREFHPTHHGFDEYFGAPMTQNECYSNLIAPGAAHKGQTPFGPCPWFNGSTDVPTWQSNGVFPSDLAAVDMLHVDDFYDASAVGFVRSAAAKRTPFFFYFASHHTHAPQFAECQSTGGADGADPQLANCTTKRGLFGDSLALLDRSVGRLHAVLDELQISEQTLTIYTADNGGSLHWGILGGTNGNLRCGKGTLWEGGVRVPAIVRWPNMVAPNSVVSALTSSLDWFFTFSALSGYALEPNVEYDGWDMSELLFTPAGQMADAGRRDRYFYHTSEASSPRLVAVRYGAWKLHFQTQGSHCVDSFPDAACYAPAKDVRATGGLLFNVERDVSEVLPLSNVSFEYQKWAPLLWSMGADYAAGVWNGASEMSKGANADRFPCCNTCSPMPTCCKCGAEPERMSML